MRSSLVRTLLADLIRFKTITGDLAANDQALDYVAQFLAERNLHIYRTAHDGYGALVATSRPTKTPRIMLTGHLDVVPASNEFFELREQGGKLFGRGVRDMKGGVATYLAAIDNLGDTLDRYDIGIMLTTDEETRDFGVLKLLDEGFRPQSAILLDGGNDWALEQLAKGAIYFAIKVAGRAAHGARPWQGDSAVLKLMALLHDVQQAYTDQGPETDTVNITNVQGGLGARNQVPDTAEAILDIRLMSQDHLEPTKAFIAELCASYGATVEVLSYLPVTEHDLANPYTASFANAITTVTGKQHKPVIAYGASDACRFSVLDIPCAVTYPPGGGHHSEHEWIEASALDDLVQIITKHIHTCGKHVKPAVFKEPYVLA